MSDSANRGALRASGLAVLLAVLGALGAGIALWSRDVGGEDSNLAAASESDLKHSPSQAAAESSSAVEPSRANEAGRRRPGSREESSADVGATNASIRAVVLGPEDLPCAGRFVLLREGNRSIDRTISDAHGNLVFELPEKSVPGRLRTLWMLDVFPPPPPVEVLDGQHNDEPLVLRVPQEGTLRVRVFDFEGEQLDERCSVELQVAGPKGRRPAFERSSPRVGRSMRGGEVRFENVAAGAEIVVVAREERWGVETHAWTHGPAGGGEKQIDLRFGTDRPVLRGTVVCGKPATPCRNLSLQVTWSERNAISQIAPRAHFETDGDGVFYFDPRPPVLEDAEFRLELLTENQGSVSRAVSSGLPPGIHDMGELLLMPDLVLVEGVVLDVDGNGVANAKVAGNLVAGRELLLTQDARTSLTTDGAGRFSWMAPCQGDDPEQLAALRIELRAEKDGCISRLFTARGGDQDVELRLLATGWVEAKLDMDSWLRSETLDVRLFPKGQRDRDHSHLLHFLHGRWTAKKVPAGTYDLRVRVIYGEPWELVLEDFEVRGREACRDPRLQGIDVRDLCDFTFRFERKLEETLVRPRVFLWPTGSKGEPLVCDAHLNDSVLATVTCGLWDARVEVPGWRTLRYEGLTEAPVYVELKPPLRVKLDLGAVVLPQEQDREEWFVSLRKNDHVGTYELPARSRRILSFELPEAGEFTAIWSRMRRAPGRGPRTLMEERAGSTLYVEESEDEQIFVLEFP